MHFEILSRARLTDICDLHQRVWGRALEPDYMEWLLFGHPAQQAPLSSVAVIEGRVEGMVGMIPAPLLSQGRAVEAAQIVHLMMTPVLLRSPLGKNLWANARRHAEEQGVECFFGYVNEAGTRFFKRRDPEFINIMPTPQRIRPLRSREVLSKRRLEWAAPVADMVLKGWHRATHGWYGRVLPDLVTDPEWPEKMALRSASSPGGTFLRKDAAWYRWRYLQHPLRRFDVLAVAGTETLAVTFIDQETRRLLICDWLPEMPEGKACGRVLAALLEHAYQLELDAVSLWHNPHQPQSASLRRQGYIYWPQKKEILCGNAPVGDALSPWCDPQAWRLHLGDSDRL